MRKILLAIAILLSISAYTQTDSTSQTKEKKSFKFDPDRIKFGGGIGGGISNYGTSINISPMVLYQFSDKFYAGPRLIYNFYSYNGSRFSNYGYGFLGRYFFKNTIFGQAEYQEIYYDWGYSNSLRQRIPSFLVGAGYFNRPVTFTAMFDLLWNSNNSPYNSPLQVNFGLMF